MQKKIMAWMLICIIILNAPQLSFANKYSEFETVELTDTLTGKTGSYQPVSLMIRGEDVFSDTPGIAIDGRTLIPISSVFIELGIPFQWIPATREIAFESNGKKIVMQINNPYATIDGKKVELPNGVSPRVMQYKGADGKLIDRTYVPVAFITSVLDLSVSWIADTRTVAINRKAQTLSAVDLFWRISATRPYPEIRLKVSGEVDATSFVVRGLDVGEKDKTIIELQNTQLSVPSSAALKDGVYTYNVSDGIFGIEKVEVAQTSTNPLITRVTIYQNMRRGHDISYDSKTGEMVIRLINTVDQINVREVFGTETLVIESSQNPALNYTVSKNTLHIDVIGSYLHHNQGVPETQVLGQDRIKSISYRELGSEMYGLDTVRISVTLDKDMTMDDFFQETIGTQTLVYFPSHKLNNFQYVKLNNSSATMSIDLSQETMYSISYDETMRKLSLRLSKDVTYLDAFNYPTNDNIIESLRVIDADTHYVIEAVLAPNTSYEHTGTMSMASFMFVNKTIQNSTYRDTLIVIDAGHGGRDPGAVGTLVQEKTVVLNSALLLQKTLESRGFKVYMTRSTDEYINLYDRASMANGLNATLFVSIHANSHTGTSANGVEVLYANPSMDSDKGLATAIQNELVKHLKATNRGVVQRTNLVVLRETKMPAVLVELGFISNPAEQLKLMDENYLKLAAEAMANGIEAFLK